MREQSRCAKTIRNNVGIWVIKYHSWCYKTFQRKHETIDSEIIRHYSPPHSISVRQSTRTFHKIIQNICTGHIGLVEVDKSYGHCNREIYLEHIFSYIFLREYLRNTISSHEVGRFFVTAGCVWKSWHVWEDAPVHAELM